MLGTEFVTKILTPVRELVFRRIGRQLLIEYILILVATGVALFRIYGSSGNSIASLVAGFDPSLIAP